MDRLSGRKVGHPDRPATQILSGAITGDSIMTGTRENNPNWQGGRSITSHGYIVIRVGSKYAYEHRIVAEKKLGRPLRPKEKVHHIDENKQNNAPENILVVDGNANHYVHHRKTTHLRKPNEPNLPVECLCGCGGVFPRYDKTGRPRKYISGHNMKDGENERRKMVG